MWNISFTQQNAQPRTPFQTLQTQVSALLYSHPGALTHSHPRPLTPSSTQPPNPPHIIPPGEAAASSPTLLQLIQVLQPRQHDLLARLLDLAGEEHLVEDRVHLVEVEDEVQLAHVPEEGVEHLDEEVDRLEVRELVVVGVDARAEEEPRVPPVDDLVVAELDEVGLVLLVPGRDEAVDLGGEPLAWGRGGEGRGEKKEGKELVTSPLSLIFSSSLYGTYHFASLVLPLFSHIVS